MPQRAAVRRSLAVASRQRLKPRRPAESCSQRSTPEKSGRIAARSRVTALLDEYLAGLDADKRLSARTRFDQVADRGRTEEKNLESDFVFTQFEGGPYHPVHLSKLVTCYSGEVGLPRLSAHGLRHTAATLMLASGVPPKVAAERLGHANFVWFSSLYAHVTPSMQRDAAEAVGRVLFG
jgi:integrase